MEITTFYRKFYPIVILGKGSLGWNLNFMKKNWIKVASLGTLPWLAEVLVLTSCVHYFLGLPIVWGKLDFVLLLIFYQKYKIKHNSCLTLSNVDSTLVKLFSIFKKGFLLFC